MTLDHRFGPRPLPLFDRDVLDKIAEKHGGETVEMTNMALNYEEAQRQRERRREAAAQKRRERLREALERREAAKSAREAVEARTARYAPLLDLDGDASDLDALMFA